MKLNFVKVSFLILVVSLLFQGYQCGSPEFTGAKVHIQQKNYKEAIRLLEIEVQKNPQNEEAWWFLGGLKADEGNYDGMNTAFNAALKISNKHAADIKAIRYNHWGQNLNAGVSFLEKASSDSAEYFEKSIAAFTRAIDSWPDTALTYKYLGYAYNNKGDLQNALTAFQKAWDKGKDFESLKRIGRIYIVRGEDHKNKFESANLDKTRLMRKLEDVKKSASKSEITSLIGAPDKINKGPKNTKKEDWLYDNNNFKLTVQIDADKVVNKSFTSAYTPNIDSTEYHLAQKEYIGAVEALEAARNADPKDGETLNALLKAYIEANRIQLAINEFEKAVAGDPSSKNNHYILGILYRQVGDFDKAIAQFKAAAGIDPNDGDILFDLAATYYNWGVDIIKAAEAKNEQSTAFKEKFELALPLMEKVSTIKKNDPTVWETLGTILARLGQQDKAMKAFDQADKIRKGN